MSEQAALFRAICEQPDDDAVRLVYADWLEENGDPELAEYIRREVALAKVPEYDEAHARKARARLDLDDDPDVDPMSRLPEPPQPGLMSWPGYGYRRGFPWIVDTSYPD